MIDNLIMPLFCVYMNQKQKRARKQKPQPTPASEANYGAKAGQTIAGNLARGNDGRFSSGGNGGDEKPAGKYQKPKLPALPKLDRTKRQRLRSKSGKIKSYKRPKKAAAAKKSGKADPAKLKTEFGEDELAKLLEYGEKKPKDREGFDFGQELADKLLKSGVFELGVDGKPALTTAGRDLIKFVRNEPYQGQDDQDQAQEANRRNSSADQELIQSLHDTAIKLGANCNRAAVPIVRPLSLGEALATVRRADRLASSSGRGCGCNKRTGEAARRNSWNDQKRIQAAHDTAVELGARCYEQRVPGIISGGYNGETMGEAKTAVSRRKRRIRRRLAMVRRNVKRLMEADQKFSKASIMIDLPEVRDLLFREETPSGDLVGVPLVYIPKANLSGHGYERESHITAFYGVDGDTLPQVTRIVQKFPPFTVKLCGVSCFERPDYDVLKIDIESPELRRLHRMIARNVPHSSERSAYHPHLTIAYLLPGRGEQYAEQYRDLFRGRKYEVKEILFSDESGNKTAIPLRGSTVDMRREKTSNDHARAIYQKEIPGGSRNLEAWRGASSKGKKCYAKLRARGYDQQKAIAICRAALKEEAGEDPRVIFADLRAELTPDARTGGASPQAGKTAVSGVSEESGGDMPRRYSLIDFTPPEAVQQAAARGLALRQKYGRGGLTTKQAGEQGIGSGVARAATLTSGRNVSPQTIKMMIGFFARHEKNKDTPPEEGNGRIAWLLWGGDPGRAWAEKIARQMDKADKMAEAVAEKTAVSAPVTIDAIRASVREHAGGKHNQKSHGYRFGKAPSVSRARQMKKDGTWGDYKQRAKAKKSGGKPAGNQKADPGKKPKKEPTKDQDLDLNIEITTGLDKLQGARHISSVNEANNRFLLHTQIVSDLPSDQKIAVTNYTTDAGYTKINGGLRSGKNPDDLGVGDLDRAINRGRMLEDTVLHRGMSSQALADSFRNGSIKPGDIFEDSGYMSTSASSDQLNKFGSTFNRRAVRMEILAPKGSRGLYIDGISEYMGEGEVLLPRGTKLRILNVGSAGGAVSVKAMIVNE